MRGGGACLVLVLAALGCGSDYRLAPVSGRVTLNGKPLAGAHVHFQPIGSRAQPSPGPGSHGVTDAEGRFTLQVDARQPGAVVGREAQIGRGDRCAIRLQDTYVSQVHARLFPKDGAWYVEDLGSTNGTLLNDHRVQQPVEVHAGDVLKVGKTVLELRR